MKNTRSWERRVFKKISVMLASVLAMFLCFYQQAEANENERIIVAQQDGIPIYNIHNGEHSIIGEMKKEEALIASSSDHEEFWKVRFGNAYGFIQKDQVQVDPEREIPAKSNLPNTKKLFL